MTQDPYGRPPGTGDVVRGEVVPDDEANETSPMTHFQKVASALRGDRTDPAAPEQGPSDQFARSDLGAGPPDAQAPDALDVPDALDDEADHDATRPEEVVAVRSPDDDESRDYWHAAAPVREGLRPGESDGALGDFSDLTYGSLLPDAAEFKNQWQEVQFRFVDNPQGSVTEAADVIAQVTAKLEAAIAERQRAIAERQRTLRDRWSEGKSTDTESLRETLLMYRAFLDQLTGPTMS
ncbi:MAG TPA: hypothetical protein VMA97_06170 [Streptosporangiaceae bacterium]|nr:hypothetical protein [Streptosporangiaceae bacterium]